MLECFFTLHGCSSLEKVMQLNKLECDRNSSWQTSSITTHSARTKEYKRARRGMSENRKINISDGSRPSGCCI
jgi:hypothetical protein